MVRRGLKTTVIATVMAMMLAPSFSAFAQTGKSNTLGSWQVENNAWVFRNAEGQSVKGWVVYNQEWYYLNPENGQLKTGWLQLDGKWYFLSTEAGAQQGRLLTGWQWIDGYCYYLMPTDDSNYGVLVVNGRTPDGYYVNQSGQWLHGENGDAVYEAGKGLPSAASSQQVAGASRALPGQVLGASRAIAAPGGGSFGGGGGGGSTGGGATASTTGGAGTATAGATTAGAATGTATGGSAAGTTTPSTEGTETPVIPAQPENPTQPETPAQPETPVQPETPAQPETPTQPENNLKNWPGTHTLSYDEAKNCFVLSFDEGNQINELQELLLSINKVTVNQTEYAVGDAKADLSKEANTYWHDLRGKEKVRGYLNALNFNKKSFHEGENTVEIQADGYNPVTLHVNATKEELQDEKLDLKKPEKIIPKDFDRTEAGEYNVKLFAFNNLSKGQKEFLGALNEVVVDDVHYQKIEEKYFDAFVRIGEPSFFVTTEGTSITLNLNYYPKEAGAHKLILKADGYENLVIEYTQAEAKSAPVVDKLEKKEAQGYYELSFQGDRKAVQNYLKSIKTLTVAGRTYGQMAPFSADLLKMGEKFSFGDSKGEKELADLLLFSIPTDNVDKEQEIRIEAEGYEVATIPLS